MLGTFKVKFLAGGGNFAHILSYMVFKINSPGRKGDFLFIHFFVCNETIILREI